MGAFLAGLVWPFPSKTGVRELRLRQSAAWVQAHTCQLHLVAHANQRASQQRAGLLPRSLWLRVTRATVGADKAL